MGVARQLVMWIFLLISPTPGSSGVAEWLLSVFFEVVRLGALSIGPSDDHASVAHGDPLRVPARRGVGHSRMDAQDEGWQSRPQCRTLSMSNEKKPAGFSTLAVHAGVEPDSSTGAIMTPVYMTSTYVQEGIGQHKGYEYSRSSNPTRRPRGRVCRHRRRSHGLAFSSGLAAVDAVLMTLRPGDEVIAGDDLYGGTRRLFTTHYAPLGIHFHFVDTQNPDNVMQPPSTSARGWSGSRRPPTRSCGCPTYPPSPPCSTGTRRGWPWTTPSPRPPCRTRSPKAPTSSCTA